MKEREGKNLEGWKEFGIGRRTTGSLPSDIENTKTIVMKTIFIGKYKVY